MCVSVESEPCRKVAQHAGYGLDINSVLESDGGEGVAEVMKSDLRDARPFKDSL